MNALSLPKQDGKKDLQYLVTWECPQECSKCGKQGVFKGVFTPEYNWFACMQCVKPEVIAKFQLN